MKENSSDQTRLLIATFIVATMLTATNLNLPSSFANNPVAITLLGAPTLGLMLSSLGAFVYALSVGYGLTYGNRQTTIRKKIKKWSYNFSVKAFLPTVLTASIVYLYAWAGLHTSLALKSFLNIVLYIIVIGTFLYLERNQIRGIYSYWKNDKAHK